MVGARHGGIVLAAVGIGGTLLSARLATHEAIFGIGPTAIAMAYRDVVIVGLTFAVASPVCMFVVRGASMAARTTTG